MLTKTRPLATLLLTCAAFGATTPVVASAATAKAASAGTILNDCRTDSVISKKYRLADLKKAQKSAKASKASKKKYTKCTGALTSAVAGLSGKAGSNSTNAIYKECVTKSALTKKYKLATLKKAAKSIPADVKNYGNGACAHVIKSQINTIA